MSKLPIPKGKCKYHLIPKSPAYIKNGMEVTMFFRRRKNREGTCMRIRKAYLVVEDNMVWCFIHEGELFEFALGIPNIEVLVKQSKTRPK